MNRLSTEKQAQVIAALVEGVSVNATCRMRGVAKHTVRRVRRDEIWQFIYAKQENVTAEQMAQGAGDCWTWTAIDADTKLILAYTLGDRGADTACGLMQDLASRACNRIRLTTDGHRVYADAVESEFGADIDYAMLVKIYGASNDNPESRYSPATCIGCRTRVLAGNHDPDHISVSFVERQDLFMRMGMRRFTRLANGFSKKVENHGHAVALYFFHLQLRSHSSDASRDSRNGSRDYGSRVVF